MVSGVSSYISVLPLLFAAASWSPLCAASPSTGLLSRRSLILDYSPAPPPEDGPPASAGALRDPSFLPAQIGGIVGAYAFSLVLVALLLLALSRTRREHLRNRDFPEDGDVYSEFNPFPEPFLLQSEEEYKRQLEQFEAEEQYQRQLGQFQPPGAYPAHFVPSQKLTLQTDFPRSPIRNFSLPSASPLSPNRTGPLSPTRSQRSAFTTTSPSSTLPVSAIERDRAMAQQQLEEIYKHVMEHEQAKAEGREYEPPQLASPSSAAVNASPAKSGAAKKERVKPSNLNLARDDKAQSRGSSIFSFLKSPRKNKASAAGLSISSPVMTPMSGTFPRPEDQEMNAMAPRHYYPPPAPPVPSDLPFRQATAASTAGSSHHLPTPDISPVSTQSIDSRIDAAIGVPPSRAARREQREREARADDRFPSHTRDMSAATSATGDRESPVSATSERSTTGLVGLPTSPRPGANRFPSLDSLPASPRPGQQSFPLPPAVAPSTTSRHSAHSSNGGGNASASGSTTSSRPTAPSAVREGGALPLRAYEPSLSSPTAASFATKQTVFTRSAAPGPLSPSGARTPWTGAPVPYTPYQPFSPVIPITPSVVTRADRKRMKRMEPKTPTVEMVRDTSEIW